ncbi:phosphomannomutase/phosphoglucomutase [Candidatus Poribacteria bacterium]|nr:phosphomannomutase/phosphoglucomutase [Candidatus Poribacteria bacterium]
MTDNGFREYDVRWLIGKEVNPNGFVVLGRAYGTFALEVLKEKRVVVGHDFRSYSQAFCHSLIIGLLSTGINVVDVGMLLTPMLYFAQHHLNTKAGLMVTASHNENGWTGIKVADGLSSTLGPEGIQAFKKTAKQGVFREGSGKYESYEGIFDAYVADILKGGKLRSKHKVVLATGNGTAGRFGPRVLRELGCEVIELDCTPDWNFPHHNPNPEDVAFLHSISAATLKHGAHLGIGLDGDGDRIGVVDGKGREIFADKLGLLIARSICPKHPGRAVVIDVKSTGLYQDDPILRQTKANVVIWKTGHSYIKAKVAETNAIAGFEKSGHWFFNEPYGRGYDDAVVSAVQLLRFLDEADAPLSELVDALPKTWQSPTLGPFCPDEIKYNVVKGLIEQYKKDKEAATLIGGFRIKDLITVNGIRFVLEDDSWGLIRASSNKPSLVLVAESRTSEDQLYDIMEHIQKRLDETGKIGKYDQQMPKRPSGK